MVSDNKRGVKYAPLRRIKMKKSEMKETAVIEEKEIDYENFEFKTIEDFAIYNKWARRNRMPVRVPTEDYYKKIKVKFQRFDQPHNVLKARVRNKDIDWQGQLIPGRVYDLPKPVIKFLNGLVEPIYDQVAVNDGSDTKAETKQVGEKAKFSCQIVDYGDD